MNCDIYKFNKSFDERIKEYELILSDYKSCEIINAWSNYLELYITSFSWTALWNISRKFCRNLNVNYPHVAIIRADCICFQNLSAGITIIDMEDCIEFNRSFDEVDNVPLKDLYITKNPENDNSDCRKIAECLDQLRIFYHHLWWPWNDELETEETWFSEHLDFRLQLYYSKLQGDLHYVSAKTVKKLIDKGRETFEKINDSVELFDVNYDEKLIDIADYYIELAVITSKLRHWENPELRQVLDLNIRKINEIPRIHIVIQECKLEDASNYMNFILELVPLNSKIKKFFNNLNESLLNYSSNDTILIAPGLYTLHQREYLDLNVNIKGLQSAGNVVLCDNQSYECFFKILTDCIIQNLELIVKESRALIIIKKGITHLSSIQFKNKNERNSTAIYVCENAKLIASNCHFLDFNIGIVCLKNSSVQLEDCIFNNNNICIESEENALITLRNCDLRGSKNVAFRCIGYECCNDSFKSLYDLNSLSNMNLQSVMVDDYEKTAIFKPNCNQYLC